MGKKFKNYEIPDEPKTYEEAVKILKESHNDEMHKDAYKGIYLRSGVTVGIGAAASIICGLVNHDFSLAPYIMSTALTAGGAFLLPILDLKGMKKRAEKGDMFEKLTEQEAINAAKKYIKIYRDYVESKTEGKQI